MAMTPSQTRSASPRLRHRRRHDDRGTVVVEAVLIVPALMLVLLVVVQCALWAHAGQVVRLAASEGDQVARSLDSSPSQGVARAESVVQTSGAGVSSSTVVGSVVAGDQVQITVTGRAVSIVPGLSLPVSAVVVGPVQEFRSSE
jgi:Flp pilus assembly protein TadG